MKPLQLFYNELTLRFKTEEKKLGKENLIVIWVSMGFLLGSSLCTVFALYKILRSLSQVSSSNENLLLSALPPALSERLKQSGASAIKECEASVLFLDIGAEGENTREKIQELFEVVDGMMEQYHVERIRTSQEHYCMIVAGISEPRKDHAFCLADFALSLREKVETFRKEQQESLYLRIGMSSGTVITGVLDHKKYIYDLWGDVLKTASHLESRAQKDEILMSKSMALELKGAFEMEEKSPFDERGDKSYCLKKRLHSM